MIDCGTQRRNSRLFVTNTQELSVSYVVTRRPTITWTYDCLQAENLRTKKREKNRRTTTIETHVEAAERSLVFKQHSTKTIQRSNQTIL